MTGSSRALSLLACMAIAGSGCGKRAPESAAKPEGEATPKPPASSSEVGLREDAPAETPAAPGTADVPPALAAADAAYEAWFGRHRLNLSDPKMLEADPDGDGASNNDEFIADTDPRDPKSLPPAMAANAPGTGVHASMRLKDYSEVRVPMMLTEVQGETARIRQTIRTGERTDSLRVGQLVPGSRWKVTKVQGRQGTDKHGERVDASRVTLEDGDTRELATLVKDLPARSSATSATLASADGASNIRVKLGETFSWPSEPGTSYKVLELSSDQAVLQQVENGQTYTVPRQ